MVALGMRAALVCLALQMAIVQLNWALGFIGPSNQCAQCAGSLYRALLSINQHLKTY